MGRVGKSASLRAMGAAWDAGITLFDTARSYGFGEAEAVLGDFLCGRRDQAVIATKFGIAAQPLTPIKRVAVPLLRIAKQLPGIGRRLKRGANAITEGQFSVSGLRSSLEASLKALQTDRVDILFLHEATPEALHNQELMSELEALVRAGKVLRVGLYGSPEICAHGLTDGPPVLKAMQFGADLMDSAAMQLPDHNRRGALLIGNHPFGSEDRVARTSAMLAAMAVDEAVPAELRDKLWGLNWDGVLEAVLGMCLARTDALVFSMMREQHIQHNVRAVEMCRFSAGELDLMQGRMRGVRP